MTLHRFHVPGARSGVMELPEATRIHATRVLRLSEGCALRVFDAGAEFEATITAMGKHRVEIEVGTAWLPLRERTVPLHLLMSPLKGDLTELVIQKATELGVEQISLVLFERTDTVARRDPSEARMERFRRVASSASEQSGRAVVPTVHAVAALEQAMERLGSRPEGEVRIVATEPSLDRNEPHHEANARRAVIAVGPAGGLSPSDLDALVAAGFRPERFALHTLRSETACLAALAILGDRLQ